MNKIKLFCFPYAGGASSVFAQWRMLLAPRVECRAIELAARGRRMREANYTNLSQSVDDVFNIIKGELNDGPYALFGHSMGSMIAFELYYKIMEHNLPAPVHVFFSGRMPPHLSFEEKKMYHNLNPEQFRKEVLELGGTPKEFFEHPELLEVFLPLLMGDFKVTETFVHPVREARIDCDISALSGLQDEYSRDEIEAWREHAGKQCTIHYFDGGHFFLNEEPRKVVDIILKTLTGQGVTG